MKARTFALVIGWFFSLQVLEFLLPSARLYCTEELHTPRDALIPVGLVLAAALALMLWALFAARRWQWELIRRERGEMPPAFPVQRIGAGKQRKTK